MSNKITENTIEQFTIELLEQLGYQYLYGPDIAPVGDTLTQRASESVSLPLGATKERVTFEKRKSYEDVLLIERLRDVTYFNTHPPLIFNTFCANALLKIS